MNKVGNLAEEFFWHNPAKLPSPIEWVNKRKIHVKTRVNTIWWFSKSDFPKANVTSVLAPYSERMKKLLKDSDKYYSPKDRPSGHQISGDSLVTMVELSHQICYKSLTQKATHNIFASVSSQVYKDILQDFPRNCQSFSSNS